MPGTPSSPASPFVPWIPSGPVGPESPRSPRSPFGPGEPRSPATPVAPWKGRGTLAKLEMIENPIQVCYPPLDQGILAFPPCRGVLVGPAAFPASHRRTWVRRGTRWDYTSTVGWHRQTSPLTAPTSDRGRAGQGRQTHGRRSGTKRWHDEMGDSQSFAFYRDHVISKLVALLFVFLWVG